MIHLAIPTLYRYFIVVYFLDCVYPQHTEEKAVPKLVIDFVFSIDFDTMKPIPFERAFKKRIYLAILSIPSSVLQ